MILGDSQVKEQLSFLNTIQAISMLPLQALANPLMSRLGVMGAFASLPTIVILMSVGMLANPSVSMFVVLRALYNSMGYTMYNTAKGLLWLPCPEQQRVVAKGFIAGPFAALARALAALIMMAFSRWTAEPRMAAAPIALIGVVWIVIIAKLRCHAQPLLLDVGRLDPASGLTSVGLGPRLWLN